MTVPTQGLDTRLDSKSSTVLSLFRVVFGLSLLSHASAHLFGWPTGPAAGLGQWPYFYAGVIELITGALVTVGLFTRVAAFVASGTMAFAFFTQHLPQGVVPMTNGGELAVLFCFAFLLLAFTGGGAIALDARRNLASPTTQRSEA